MGQSSLYTSDKIVSLAAKMHFLRSTLSFAFLICLLAAIALPQSKKNNPEEGYNPTVAPENKKKKKEETQVLALPPELPAAVSVETDRLVFQVSPLSAKGLLSQQTRDALKGLLHSSRGPIVKLRAFVAGSGDLRRIGDIAAEMFSEKHLPLPALTAVQVGALPLEGAQVIIEATEADHKVVNPSGLAFVAAQPASSISESLAKLTSLLASNGIEPSGALLVTCFVSSLDVQRDTQAAMSHTFPTAVLDYVQMQRAPVEPAAACETVARLTKPASGSDSQIARISSQELVISGTQLAFGNQDSDFKLAFSRLEKALQAKGAALNRAVLRHFYVTSAGLANRIPPGEPTSATSFLPVEALPSVDSPLGLDVIAIPSP